jgi:hypothetical protein
MPLEVSPPGSSRFGSTLVLSRLHWVRPELVVEVKYLAWTGDNLLRQVVHEGLRRQACGRGAPRDAAYEVIDASGDVTLSCTENLSVLIASACDFFQYAVRIVPSESLTQKPRCPG